MNKLVFLVCFLLVNIISVNGQFVYNERTIEEQIEIDKFGEKLVELALIYHPDFRIAQENSQIAKKEEVLAKNQWLDQLKVTGNLNEFAINPPDDVGDRNLFFPRYNISLQIPLGIFIRQPVSSGIAAKQYQISLLNIEGMKAAVRKEVLTQYNNYLLQRDLYDIQLQMTQDSEALLQVKENSFANGEINLLEYDAAIQAYQKGVENLLRSKNSYLNSELMLEQWIGIPLEEVSID